MAVLHDLEWTMQPLSHIPFKPQLCTMFGNAHAFKTELKC